jgi:hypothetical protein
MQMFQAQSSPFAAKVRFFDGNQVRDVIASLLAKFYRAAKTAEADVEEVDDADDQGSHVESFNEMQVTVTAFTSLFCDREGFESEGATRRTLKKAQSENDQRLLRLLVPWAEELVQLHLGHRNLVTFESATTELLLFKLRPYTHQIPGLDGACIPAPWPLVAAIDFGLDHPLLNEGIIFVDSPGLTDVNSARSQNAARYHRECSHMIAAADIGRAESDAALRTSLEMSYRIRGSGSTILVLTRGDSIDPETEVIGTPAEKTQVSKLTAKIKDLRLERQKTLQERMNLPHEDRDELDDQLWALSAQIKEMQTERDCCRLEMRNRKVSTRMQELYKAITSDSRPLPVFAVGNAVYEQYQMGFTADEKPSMSVKQTNIPDLRYRLYMMPIEGRLNETLHFVEVQLPNLINSVELYCSQIYMARKRDIESIVLEPKTKLRDIVSATLDVVKEKVTQTILEPMKNHEEEWINEAREICRSWTTTYNGSLPLIRAEGFRAARRGVAEINWDAELTDIGSEWIERDFGAMGRDWALWVDPLIAEFQKLCLGTRDRIKSKPPSPVSFGTTKTF